MSSLRFALRQLVKSPGFTITAVASFALGIGLVATQFSLIDAVLLRNMPLPDVGKLYHIGWQLPKTSEPERWDVLPHRDYLLLRERQTHFESLAATQWLGLNLSGTGRVPSRHTGSLTTANLLETVRMQPMLGRWFTAEEDRPGQPLFIILSHTLWQEAFGGLPAVLGSQVNINGEPGTIIGIMPPKFAFPGSAELWINLRAIPADPRERLVDRVEVFGRLKPEATPELAKVELDGLAASFAKLWPETNAGYDRANLQTVVQAYSGGGARPMLFLMLAMTLFILALACVNVATMLLGRATLRTRELAVRAAVGATRGHLIFQLLLESLLLAILGCLGGLLVAQTGVDFLQGYLVTQRTVPEWMEFRLDERVLAVAVISTLLAGILAGIVPAWQCSHVDVNTALKDVGRGSSGAGAGRLTRWLVSAQIAFATMLLVAAGVMSLTVYEARLVNLRYNPDKLLTGRIELQEGTQPTPEARARFYRRLLERLQAEPGVEAVAVSSRNFIGPGVPTQIETEGSTFANVNERPVAWLEVVSSDFFRLISVKPVSGRLFDNREQTITEERSVIINDSFARRFFPRQDPLGRRFRTNQTQEKWVTVIGVVPDLQMQGTFDEPGRNEAGFYLAQDQMGWGWLDLFIRTKADALQLVDPMRRAIAEIDPNQPIHSVGTLASQTAQALRGFTILGILAAVFALISLFLGAIGVYGVTTQAVNRRTREFGVRMALGSTVGQLLRLVLRQGGQQIALGLAIGLVGGFLLTRPLEQVFGSSMTNNPLIYVGVAVTISAIGLLALWLPARRAAKVDPNTALRAE
ncbi:ABC transporter permease [Oleiharenicola lentus]|uniref:ABC transporter permease n=1 Tax=Oleiharenicola lentus TaxID=2508720 RepID=A0A4Q1CAC6_9BACT|nr:ABC transporter permease [Oleiharenicola lentus]RXK56025.1 ABC transporter permease [Oleiharenicola lentus]